MPSNSRSRRSTLRRTVQKGGEFISNFIPMDIHSVIGKVKWAKKNGYLERKLKSKGKYGYGLTPTGRYEFFKLIGSEKPWGQLSEAQQQRMAAQIIDGAMAKYQPGDREELARVIQSDVNSARYRYKQFRRFLLMGRQEPMSGPLSFYAMITPDEARRVKNGITILEAVVNIYLPNPQ